MKRFLLLVVVSIVLVFLLLFAFRHSSVVGASIATSILPSDTVLFLHIPDAVKNQQDWHKTDLYALYREPAVQQFLGKPRAKLSKKSQLTVAWRDVGALRIRDLFVATNTLDALRLVGGFEFRCDKKQAESIIETWKSKLIARAPGTQRNTIEYEKHSLDVIKGETVIASTFVGSRFLAASNTDDLKALLDRIDHRTKTAPLQSDENFRVATKQMPSEYAWMFYLQPKQFAQKLAALRAENGRRVAPDQQTMLERVQSFSHAMVFQGAKIKDVDFVAMPQLLQGKLTRDTLTIASADTFLYVASLLNLEQQIEWIQQGGNPATPILQQINSALVAAGVTEDDWRTAFSNEFSLLVDWPANTRIPTGVATLGVRDSARANKIVQAVTAASGWQSTTRNKAQYYAAPSEPNLIAISPMVAVNDHLLVFGLERASVDRAMEPPPALHLLTGTENFKSAAKVVPQPQQTFLYLDLANLYSRLDSTLRPILQMSAAFLPALSKDVDVAKIPDAQVVVRHLGPVVASQSYIDSGYRSESVGTISVTQAAGVAAIAWLGTSAFKNQSGVAFPNLPRPSASPSPAINNPSPTP